MAKFEVDVGDATYEVDAPDERTAWNWANITHQKENAPQKEYGIGERAKSALSSGLSQVPESLAGIGLGLKSAVGMDESVNRQAEAIRAEAQKPKEGPTGITFKELEDTYGRDGAIAALKKMPAYVAEQILQSAPSMAGPLAAGATGTMLGGPIAGAAAGIGSYGLQQFGNFMNRQAQEGATAETLAPGRAAAAAAITAPIGFYADKLTLGFGSIPEKVLGKEVMAELAKRLGGPVARGATGAISGVVAEAPTEVLEQVAERWQAGLPLNDEQAKAEYKEAFFGAAAVGGTIGGGAHILAGGPQSLDTGPVPLKSVDLAPEEEKQAEKQKAEQLMIGMTEVPRIGMNPRMIELDQQSLANQRAEEFGRNVEGMQPAGASDVTAMPGMTGAPNANMSMMEQARATREAQVKAAEKERKKQIKEIQAGDFHADPIQNQNIKDQLLAQLGVTPVQAKAVFDETIKEPLTPEEIAMAEARQPMPGEGVSPNAGLTPAEARAQQRQIEKANAQNKPAPAYREEINQLAKDRAAAQKALNEASKNKGNLFEELRGKIGVRPGAFGPNDINMDESLAKQLVNKEGRGRLLEDMVADGSLDEYLTTPHSSPSFDAQAAVQEIADKLANKDYRSTIASAEMRKAQEERDRLDRELDDLKSMPDANAKLDKAAQELADVEALSSDDLLARAQQLGIDTEGIAQDVAVKTDNMTAEQYHGEVRKALISAINSQTGGTETLAQAKGDQKGFTATKEDLKTQAEIKGKTMIGLAEWAIKNAPNKFSKFVGEKVLARLKALEKQGVTLNFKVEDGNRRPNSLYSASGSTEFVWGADGNHTVISIALNGAPVMENQNGYPSGLGYDTILHELLHAATRGQMRFLASTDPLVKELRSLYNTVVDHFNAEVKAGRITPFMERIYKRNNNALLNPDELISWGLTDKEMQDFLNNIKVGEKTVMDKIVQLVRELLGIPKPFETALDRLVRTTDKLLEADVKVLANGMVREGYTLGRKPGQQTLFSKKAQELFGKEDSSNEKAPSWVPEKIWRLHELARRADAEASGYIDLRENAQGRVPSPGALKRNQTMTFRRLNKAVEDYVGNDWNKVNDLMVRMNTESSRRETEAENGPAKTSATDSAAFKKWFRNSKAVDANGNPKVVYHSTFSDFEKPKTNYGEDEYRRWGFHVGSLEAAEGRLGIKQQEDLANSERSGNAAANIIPAYIRAENPLRLNENRTGRWGVDDIMRAVMEKADKGEIKGIDSELVDAYFNDMLDIDEALGISAAPGEVGYDPNQQERFWSDVNEWSPGERSEMLKALLKQAGYDSIVYSNEFEKGGDSYILFDANQVKSTFNKGKFSERGEILEKRAGKGKPQPTSKGQESIDLLDELGRGAKKPDPTYREKVEATWNNAKANPEATYEHFKDLGAKQVSKFKTAVFSSDAAFQDAYEEYVNQMSISDQAKLGLIMQARTSQASHADAVAGVVLEMGSAKYDQSTYKWKGVKTKDNFMALRKVLDKIQNQNGYTSEEMDAIYHAALEARQTDQMVKYNQSLVNKIANLEAEMETIKEDFKSGALEPKEIARDVKRTAEIKKEIAKLKTKEKTIHLSKTHIAKALKFFEMNPALEEAVDIWNGIRKNIMDVMVEGGQYSREDAAFLLDNVDYVPMFREMDQDAQGGPVDSMRGLRAAADKARKGSLRPVNDIFDNQVRWVEYAVSRAVKAHQARTMMDVGVEAGLGEQFNPNVTPSSKMKNVVKIWRDGKEEHYTMSDPLFMDAFVGLQSVSIPMFKVAAKFANFLRQSIVMYPLFSVAQVSQDSVAAIFTSGLKPQFALKIPVLAVKELIQTMRNKSANHAILKEYGAVGVRDVNSTVVRLDAEAKFALNKDPSIKNKVTGWLNNFAMAADNSVRQAVYQASLDAGKTHSEALEKAFEIFNVRRRGTSKALAMAGQVIPFFPAYLAAQHVAFNVLTGKGTSPTQKKEAYKVLAQTTASVMVLSMLYAMMNGDDDDYLKKPASQRDRLLMIPGTGGISIPLRADVFLFPKILAEHTYLLLSDKGYEDGRKFRDSMASALESALSSPTAVPQIVKPLIEVGINYNFFQQRPLIGTFQQKLMTERQFTDSTSEFSKLLGQTGLIAPINADHLIRGMFGSFGGLALWMTNDLLATANPSGQRSNMTMQDAIATMPGTSGFVSKSYESALKKDFYTLKEEVDRATNTMNELKKNSPQQIPDFIGKEENMAKLSISKAVNKIGEDLSKIRATMKQIQNSDMSGAEKQMRIKELRNAEEQMLQSIDVKKLRELGKI